MRIVRWDLRENFNKPSGMGIKQNLIYKNLKKINRKKIK
jgi:hypothetical protein